MRKDIFEVRNKQTRTVIGLMSGTSADGIDAVLTKITGSGLDIKVEEQDFLFLPFSKEVQERIILVANGAYGGAKELCELANYLGKQYAYACEKLCEKAGIPKEEVDLVGNHGQTVWHMPEQAQYLHDMVRGTLQIGEDSYIAQALGCPVVGDFRVRDMAAGGLGAPLVPYVEYLLYRKENQTIALQNIGGIGNVTLLPKNCTLDEVTAFDTGPGNMLIDAYVSRMTKEEKAYDEGGKLAAQGKIHQGLLDFLMKDPYLPRKIVAESITEKPIWKKSVSLLQNTTSRMWIVSEPLPGLPRKALLMGYSILQRKAPISLSWAAAAAITR